MAGTTLPEGGPLGALIPSRKKPRQLTSTLALAFLSGFFVHAILTSAIPPAASPSTPGVRIPALASPAAAGTFCHDSTCVFDIGHNTGQDARYYLADAAHTGVRVVAVDANPALMRQSETRMASAVADGLLRLVTAGLAGRDGAVGSLTFWTNKNDKFSSFNESLGCRNGYGKVMPPGNRKYCARTIIPTRTCASLVEEFGTPVYAKVDIEGYDMMCVRSMLGLRTEQRPQYLSVENVFLPLVDSLVEAGYHGFKAVDQGALQTGLVGDEEGISGPWGDEAVDVLEGKKWLSAEALKRRVLPRSKIIGGRTVVIWYDMHAKLGD